MIILGIDPGIATMGYGIIKEDKGNYEAIDYGVLSTHKDLSVTERLVLVAKGVKQLIEKFKPDTIAVEELFFSSNRKTAMLVSQARGVILLICHDAGVPISEYTPNQIKQAVSGYGSADKRQVQQMVRMLLRLTSVPKPDDAADALAIALCHGQTGRFSTLFRV